MAAVACWLLLRRRRYDVIYVAGLHLQAAIGAVLARRPNVARVQNPVRERARRLSQLQDDTLLRRRLAASTRALAAEWRFERTSDEVESLLRKVLSPGA
jgi:hypothetical protein